MGQAKVRKANGTYFGQPGYAPLVAKAQSEDEYAFPCLCESGRMFERCCGRKAVGYDDENGSLHNPVSTRHFVYTNAELQQVTFDPQFAPAQWVDKCDGCGGTCDWVNVPDKVWKKLGLGKEFLCMRCISRLVHPSLSGTIVDLAQAILTKKKEFGLEETNQFFEAFLPDDYTVMQMYSIDLPRLTREQFLNHSLTPRKQTIVHPVPLPDANGIFPAPRLQSRQIFDVCGWVLYLYAEYGSDHVWYIESQIKNRFAGYCAQQNLQIEAVKTIVGGGGGADKQIDLARAFAV